MFCQTTKKVYVCFLLSYYLKLSSRPMKTSSALLHLQSSVIVLERQVFTARNQYERNSFLLYALITFIRHFQDFITFQKTDI